MPPTPESRKQKKEPVGPTVSIFIILLLMIAGAIYFWYAREHPKVDVVPYIPGDSSTTTSQ